MDSVGRHNLKRSALETFDGIQSEAALFLERRSDDPCDTLHSHRVGTVSLGCGHGGRPRVHPQEVVTHRGDRLPRQHRIAGRHPRLGAGQRSPDFRVQLPGADFQLHPSPRVAPRVDRGLT